MTRSSGLVLLSWLGACTTPTPPATATGPTATPVEVEDVRQGVLREEVLVLGNVHAQFQAELAVGADGEIVALDVRLGDLVRQGDLLLRIDPSLARARVAAADASGHETRQELEQATRDRHRAEHLGANVLAEMEIEQNVTRAKALEARAEQLAATRREARVQLDRHVLRAPFDGVISARHVDLGDWVSAGEAALALIDDRRLEVIASVEASLVERLEHGASVRLRRGPHEMPGNVVGIVRALDPTTRTAPVRIVPAEGAPWLLPGAAIDVVFVVERSTEDGTVLVPRDAIVYGAVGTRVVQAVDGKAHLLDVRVEACARDLCLVRADSLRPGERVVTRGNERLRPEQALSIATPSTDAPTSVASSTAVGPHG